MTKKKKIVLILAASLMIVLLKKESITQLAQTFSSVTIPAEGIGQQRDSVSGSVNNLAGESVDGLAERKVIDKDRKAVNRVPASVGYVNTPSPEWKEKLETSLRKQGGSKIVKVKVHKEKSFVWMRDENSLLVESVIISVKNDQHIESSFRALVDSQTGKVLETWDQSIFDPANVRDGFRIKLDSRYTN